MFCSEEGIAAYTNTNMEVLVLDMLDKVICTTNVKQNKGFDKNKRLYKDMPEKNLSPVTLDMQQEVKQARKWSRQTLTNDKDANRQWL